MVVWDLEVAKVRIVNRHVKDVALLGFLGVGEAYTQYVGNEWHFW